MAMALRSSRWWRRTSIPDAPVKRVAGAESIIPSSAYADQMVVPQVEDIVRAVKELF
jgi:pyruvate/2-oxoglutarate/acetoin dehydrogenase E1 component